MSLLREMDTTIIGELFNYFNRTTFNSKNIRLDYKLK